MTERNRLRWAIFAVFLALLLVEIVKLWINTPCC